MKSNNSVVVEATNRVIAELADEVRLDVPETLRPLVAARVVRDAAEKIYLDGGHTAHEVAGMEWDEIAEGLGFDHTGAAKFVFGAGSEDRRNRLNSHADNHRPGLRGQAEGAATVAGQLGANPETVRRMIEERSKSRV